MTKKFTVFTTYLLKTNKSGYGYPDNVHCGYINKLQLDEIGVNEINIYFNSEDDFKFLMSTTASGYGFIADEMHLIIQIVENEYDDLNDEYIQVNPKPDSWKFFDVTDQINNHNIGGFISKENIATSVFYFSLPQYNSSPIYNIGTDLPDLNYPVIGDLDGLSFGTENFLFGNVSTGIESTVFTSEIPITLGPDEFNYSTNTTWEDDMDVYVSEVGIYDDNDNLVAIGKLNHPIRKAPGISRTIIFGVDF